MSKSAAARLLSCCIISSRNSFTMSGVSAVLAFRALVWYKCLVNYKLNVILPLLPSPELHDVFLKTEEHLLDGTSVSKNSRN